MIADLLLAAALLTADDPACANPLKAGYGGEPSPPLLHKRSPAYPKKARERGMAGTVLVAALVCRDGRVHDVKVVDGIPWTDGVLEEEALRTVRTWMYRPPMKDGQPIAVSLTASVRFTLEKETDWPQAQIKLNIKDTTLDHALALFKSAGVEIEYVGSSPPVSNRYEGWTVQQILRSLADYYALKMELLAPNRLRVIALPAHDEAGVVPPVIESKTALERPADVPNDAHGTIGLNVAVATDGTVAAVAVVRSSAGSSVNYAALEAARKWRYRPATREGRPLAVYVPAEIEY
jgi:TonB family protein